MNVKHTFGMLCITYKFRDKRLTSVSSHIWTHAHTHTSEREANMVKEEFPTWGERGEASITLSLGNRGEERVGVGDCMMMFFFSFLVSRS